MVVVDHFLKYAQAFPKKYKSGRAVAEILFNKYFIDFWFHQRILQDQGRGFDNKVFKWLEELTSIKKSWETPYHPMGNRHCKHMNRTIINMLTTLEEKCKSNYNNTKHRTTNHSPHFLLFRWQGRFPIAIIFGIEHNNFQITNYDSYVKNWQKALRIK